MTLTFYWEPTLSSFMFSALWIFRDITLILYARTMKKRGIQSKFNNLLFVMGILFVIWNVALFFRPGLRLSYFLFPEDSELAVFFSYIILFDSIQIIIVILLGISLSIYFGNKENRGVKKPLIGPVLFLLGQVIFLIFILFSDYMYVFQNDLFDDNYEVYLTGSVVITSISVVGTFFIFLYSMYLNRDYLIMFCGLMFASYLVSFIYIMNNTIAYFDYLFRYGW